MKEQLTFKIDCEWLCNFVRQRVYWEGMSFQWGLETLQASFGNAITEEQAFSILTGVKKIVGINGGDFVDDDKLKDYLEYIKRRDKAELRAKLDEHISLNPLNYLDIFATTWSVKEFKRQMDECKLGVIMRDLRKWFCQPPADNDELFDGGLYSLQLATSVVVTEEDKFRFYEQLYDYWQKRLEQSHWTQEERKKIVLRQKSYTTWFEKKTGKKFRSSTDSKKQVTVLSDEEIEKREREKLPHWVVTSEKTFNLCRGSESYYQAQAKYVPTEEGVFFDYGLISPTGDFYACTFASHETAATLLCVQLGYYGKLSPKTVESIETSERDIQGKKMAYLCSDLREESKDLLYDRGGGYL